MSAQQLGGLVWNIFMVLSGFGLAITGPRYLHLIDKGFPAKKQRDPKGADKQVRVFRVLGVAFGCCGLGLILLQLLKSPH
jgi:hypothetical protein